MATAFGSFSPNIFFFSFFFCRRRLLFIDGVEYNFTGFDLWIKPLRHYIQRTHEIIVAACWALASVGHTVTTGRCHWPAQISENLFKIRQASTLTIFTELNSTMRLIAMTGDWRIHTHGVRRASRRASEREIMEKKIEKAKRHRAIEK